jgi:hypothetical protein
LSEDLLERPEEKAAAYGQFPSGKIPSAEKSRLLGKFQIV